LLAALVNGKNALCQSQDSQSLKGKQQKDATGKSRRKVQKPLNFFILGDFMPIWTTYLGFLNKHGGADKVAQKIGSCFVYFVMINRGNNEVAPSEELLRDAKKGRILWEDYEEEYLREIRDEAATSWVSKGGKMPGLQWMEKRAGEAKVGNILLVCFEKDAGHCHRRLLAEEIARRFGAEYKGELEEPAHIYSLDGKFDKFDYQ